jgi:hypothetical protein
VVRYFFGAKVFLYLNGKAIFRHPLDCLKVIRVLLQFLRLELPWIGGAPFLAAPNLVQIEGMPIGLVRVLGHGGVLLSMLGILGRMPDIVDDILDV